MSKKTCYCPYNKQTTFVGDIDFDVDQHVRVGGLQDSISDYYNNNKFTILKAV